MLKRLMRKSMGAKAQRGEKAVRALDKIETRIKEEKIINIFI